MNETAKIPNEMPDLSWAKPNDSAAVALFNATGAGGGNSKAGPTVITSGSSGYDGTSDPGKPGEPV